MASEQPFADVPIDAVRAFWNTRPCNIRHSPKQVGTREYFDEVEHRKYFVEPHIPAFADFRALGAANACWRSAAASGTDTVNFARAGAHVTAIDLSDESAAIARQRLEVFGLERSRDDSRRQRRGAPVDSAAADVRPRVLVRRDPPFAASAAHRRAPAAVHDARRASCG